MKAAEYISISVQIANDASGANAYTYTRIGHGTATFECTTQYIVCHAVCGLYEIQPKKRLEK